MSARETAEAIRVRIDTLRTQRDFFRAVDMDIAADHCEQAAIAYEGDLLDVVEGVPR